MPDLVRAALPSACSSLIVAFSGGPDSTALALAAAELARQDGLDVLLAHLDHALDPGSAARAARAAELADRLALPFHGARLEEPRPAGISREVFARRARYRFLHQLADSRDAAIATAHHADDQAETVLLRLDFGSGFEGLAAIAPREGRLIRPFLTLRRRALLAAVAAAGLEPTDDPTNRDLRVPRNALRAGLLPAFLAEEPDLVERLAALAAAARGARARVAGLLARTLDARAEGPHAASCELAAFAKLPPECAAPALALLHRLAGASLPPPAEARAELRRQLAAGGRVGCACGRRDGIDWRWHTSRGRLHTVGGPAPAHAAPMQIIYTGPGASDLGPREQSGPATRTEEDAAAHPSPPPRRMHEPKAQLPQDASPSRARRKADT